MLVQALLLNAEYHTDAATNVCGCALEGMCSQVCFSSVFCNVVVQMQVKIEADGLEGIKYASPPVNTWHSHSHACRVAPLSIQEAPSMVPSATQKFTCRHVLIGQRSRQTTLDTTFLHIAPLLLSHEPKPHLNGQQSRVGLLSLQLLSSFVLRADLKLADLSFIPYASFWPRAFA